MENKKLTTKTTLSVLASLLLATNLYSTELSSITITSSSIEVNEIDSTMATEIYTQEDIKKTNSKNLYDFLNSSTSIITIPNSGNDLVHSIDMRGYGTRNGYKSLVVTLNGRRLNSIDSMPQLLSAINIDEIEKIEILKGGSSVEFGDGANSGSINIITKAKYDNEIKAYYGSNNTKFSSLSLGLAKDKFILNGYLDYFGTDGSRYIDAANTKKDEKWAKNKSLSTIIYPSDNLEISLGKSYSNISNNYSNSLTLDEFNNSINEYGSAGTNSKVYITSNVLSTGFKYFINDKYTLEAKYNDENKLNRNINYNFESRYDYKDHSTKLNYKNDNIKISIGFDGFDGEAKGSSDLTTKDNNGIFFSSNYNLDNKTVLNFGGRYEEVDYSYESTSANETYSESLNALEIGINRKLNNYSSIYANINKSFQTADIDMFFSYPAPSYTKTFNNFLKPTISKNLNIGYNYFTDKYKLKISAFYSKLKDEIYYLQDNTNFIYMNTNLNKTKKYGFELYNKYYFTKSLYGSINYNYIIAKIIEEDSISGAYNNKYMPGVSKHNFTLNLGYKYKKYNVDLIHKYRSEAYAGEDFQNNFSQKQKAYNSTNLSFGYNYKDFEFFAKINNIFDRKNGIWLRDDVITPINFERTYYAGLKYKF